MVASEGGVWCRSQSKDRSESDVHTCRARHCSEGSVRAAKVVWYHSARPAEIFRDAIIRLTPSPRTCLYRPVNHMKRARASQLYLSLSSLPRESYEELIQSRERGRSRRPTRKVRLMVASFVAGR